MAEWPLVGRERELEAVAEELERPHSGGVVFAGSVGVGKTRLLVESRRMAQRVGFTTVRITPTHTATGIPFAAVAAYLPGGDEPASEARLLRGAVRGITDTALGRPLLVVVDDAHLLDDRSATVITQLATEERAFVVAAVATAEPAPDAVVGLWKEGWARRVEVGPLNPQVLTALVETVLGGPIESASGWMLWQQTGGNPLFLRELLLAATADGVLREQDGIWRLSLGPITSTRLVELVDRRLRDLQEEHRLALALVAFGEPVGVGIVEGACGAEVIEALERQHLVVVEPNGARIEARLPHHLYGEALRSSAPPLLARAAYKVLIEAVRATGARRRDDSLRLATWTLDSGDALDAGSALIAARAAAAASSFGLAAQFASRAFESGGGLDAALLLSEALGYEGRFEEADSVIAAVEDLVSTDEEVMALVVNRAAGLFAAGRDEAAIEVHDWALGRIDDPAARSELVCLLAWNELLLRADPVGALGRVEPFLEGPVSRTTVRAAVVAGLALPLVGRTGEALALSDRRFGRYVDLHVAPQVMPPALHEVFRSLALCYAGRPADAVAHADATHRASIEDRSSRVQAWAAMELARAHLFLGNTIGGVSIWVQLAWSASCRAPGTVECCEGEGVGPDPLRSWRVSVAVTRSWRDDEIAVAHGFGASSLFEESEEQQPAGSAGAPVEAERELVEVVLQVGDSDPALMSAEQPPLDQ